MMQLVMVGGVCDDAVSDGGRGVMMQLVMVGGVCDDAVSDGGRV